MTPLEQKKKNRFLFLELLYNDSNGDSGAMLNMWEIGEELKLDRSETRQIVDYLTGENLIEPIAIGGGICLTHYGIKEVEKAHENPNMPTEHFLPINIINIGTMTNSTLQQSTNNSTINFQLDAGKLQDIDALLTSINQIKDKLNLPINLYQELLSEIQTVQIQKQSPKPKSTIITESLKSMRTILENVVGNTMTPIIIEQITKLVA